MKGEGSIYRLMGREMDGQEDGEGGSRCTQKGAHGLCLFRANREVTLVTRRISVRG